MQYYLLSLFIFVSSSHHSIAMTLEQKWTYEKMSPSLVDSPNLLKGKHVLFVAGIMNELAALISSYYSDNMDIAKDLGATVSYFGPSSQKSIPDNADILYRKILKLSHETQKKLVLVGHSKGGAELFYAILKHPELFSRHIVDKVILIQPAIGGSPLTEKTCGWCIDLISNIAQPNLETLGVEKSKSNFDEAFHFFHDGLKKISQNRPQKSIDRLKNAISNRIFYVRSQEEHSNLSLGVSLVLGIFHTTLDGYGKNDGLLLVDAQMDPRIGVDLGILKADHIGLTVSSVSNITRQDRQAFTRALFHHVFERRAPINVPNNRPLLKPYNLEIKFE